MDNKGSKSPVEIVAGSLTTEVALTAIGAAAGGVLAPLLPILAKSLAATRQQARVEATLKGLAELLQSQEARIQSLTDAQYKLTNEAILSILQTTQAEKLRSLQNVVRNVLDFDELEPQEAIVLSRIVRDISSEEVNFLVEAFKFDSVRLVDSTAAIDFDGGNGLRIRRDSREALSVSGLLSLGLLAPGETSWGGTGSMMFTPMVGKLLALLRTPD